MRLGTADRFVAHGGVIPRAVARMSGRRFATATSGTVLSKRTSVPDIAVAHPGYQAVRA
jgi:hypothetical protein